VNETLYTAAARSIHRAHDEPAAHEDILGLYHFDKVINVDQSPIGRTPRSNPATYTGLFTHIRDLMTEVPAARERGYGPGRFSCNVNASNGGGRCEACQGEGNVTVEMQFMADIHLTCESCKGKRFKNEILEVTYKDKNISEVLDMTIDEAIDFFSGKAQLVNRLLPLQEVGLGYIGMGQSSNTLSGGEAQRVKLASFLGKGGTKTGDHILFIFDEPTTGLHFHDISKLLISVNALIEQGHSVLIIEHNTEVIKCADWVIDLGPEGGNKGGNLTFAGTPEDLAKEKGNFTGAYL
jgi:excinuclease ABC subunit A